MTEWPERSRVKVKGHGELADEAGLERLVAQIDEQLALSGLERGEQVAH